MSPVVRNIAPRPWRVRSNLVFPAGGGASNVQMGGAFDTLNPSANTADGAVTSAAAVSKASIPEIVSL